MEDNSPIVRLSALVKRFHEFMDVQDSTQCPVNVVEIRDLLTVLEPKISQAEQLTLAAPSQCPLVEGTRFSFKSMDPPQKMLYCTKVSDEPIPDSSGVRFVVDRTKVEWHGMSDSSKISIPWIETCEGGVEGRWTRQRVDVWDLQVPAYICSPWRLWVVSKIERKPGIIKSMSRPTVGKDEIYVTARSFSVVCRFFLGEGEGCERPLSSIEILG